MNSRIETRIVTQGVPGSQAESATGVTTGKEQEEHKRNGVLGEF